MRTKDTQKIIIQQLSGDLEDLESYTKDLWRFLPLPTCYINPFHVILDANLALEEFLGRPLSELVGERVEELFVNKNQVQEIYKRVLKQEKIVNQEGKVLTKKGQEKTVNISASARRRNKNYIIGYYLAFADISELKKFQVGLERKVEERTKELKKRVEELEKFHKFAVGRELKMQELKREIERLKEGPKKIKPSLN
jgi:PAS domain S-box-containing protein